MKVIKNITLLVTAIGIHICSSGIAQSLDSRIHDRGTLHETVYNDGTIGRPWQTGEAGNRTTRPLMEWPSRSAVILDGIEYSGQHNLLGAGMYMAANLDGKPGKPNRIYSLCGGVGASSPETIVGRWSFPISQLYRRSFFEHLIFFQLQLHIRLMYSLIVEIPVLQE